MSEWKKYDETTFTDFGSVGETQPATGVDGLGGGYDGSTIPVGGAGGFDDDLFGGKTIDENAEENNGLESWDSVDEKTQFDDIPVVNEAGETIRPATGWLVCIE